MLSRSSRIRSSSALRSPENIQPLQEYQSGVQSSADFPAIDEDLADAKGEERSSTGEEKPDRGREDPPELEFFLPNNDFGELFSRFFVMGHKQLVILQARMRRERDITGRALHILREDDHQQAQALRSQYYRLQMILFNMSRGHNHHSTL